MAETEHPDNPFFRRMIAEKGVAHVAPDAAELDASILVCMTTEEGVPPAVPSDHGLCDGGCGDEIFWSKNSPRTKRRLCKRCARVGIATAKPGEFQGLGVTTAIAAEIAAAIRRGDGG
jgi:hypothetical protein